MPPDSNTPEEYLKQLQESATRQQGANVYTASDLPSEDPPAMQSSGPGGSRGASPRTYFVGLAVGVGLVIAIAIVVGLLASGDDDGDRSTDLASASGVQKERGEQAIAALDRFTVPNEWAERDEPEISMSGDDDHAYAFYDLNWTAPSDYTVDDFYAWFAGQPLVSQRDDEATCEAPIDRATMDCEVELYAVDADGGRDYDRPRQTVRFTFRSDPDEGVLVFAEAYATD